MENYSSLLVSLRIVISTSNRGLCLGPGMLVSYSDCGICGLLVVVIARNVRICIDSIRDIVLRTRGII